MEVAREGCCAFEQAIIARVSILIEMEVAREEDKPVKEYNEEISFNPY